MPKEKQTPFSESFPRMELMGKVGIPRLRIAGGRIVSYPNIEVTVEDRRGKVFEVSYSIRAFPLIGTDHLNGTVPLSPGGLYQPNIEREAAFMHGMVFGGRSRSPVKQKEKFRELRTSNEI